MKLIFVSLFLLIGTHFGFSQRHFSYEIGVIVGPVQFRSDFGEREHDGTNIGNSGFGIGAVLFMNFSDKANNYFNDHFKIRSEISYNKTELSHHGRWTTGNSDDAAKLRAHTGVASNVDAGLQLEYYPFSVRDFQSFRYRFSPFASLGVHFTKYSPKVFTTFGDKNSENSTNYWSTWEFGSIDASTGSILSAVSSLGVRYKLTPLSDLMLDLRLQYYGNDWVDGLNHQLDSNKNSDWLIWLNFGYIYYIN